MIITSYDIRVILIYIEVKQRHWSQKYAKVSTYNIIFFGPFMKCTPYIEIRNMYVIFFYLFWIKKH